MRANGYGRVSLLATDGSRLHVQVRPDSVVLTDGTRYGVWADPTVRGLAASVVNGECPAAVLADAVQEAGDPSRPGGTGLPWDGAAPAVLRACVIPPDLDDPPEPTVIPD